jgi:hypothetical protein
MIDRAASLEELYRREYRAWCAWPTC